MKSSAMPFVNPRDDRDHIATLEYGLRVLEQRREDVTYACRVLRDLIESERTLAHLPPMNDAPPDERTP